MRPRCDRRHKYEFSIEKNAALSALGRKWAFCSAIDMSTLPPKADIRRCKGNIRLGPIADMAADEEYRRGVRRLLNWSHPSPACRKISVCKVNHLTCGW